MLRVDLRPSVSHNRDMVLMKSSYNLHSHVIPSKCLAALLLLARSSVPYFRERLLTVICIRVSRCDEFYHFVFASNVLLKMFIRMSEPYQDEIGTAAKLELSSPISTLSVF